MAVPTILVNSATGSDSAASGAGPATALTGTAASTSGDGLTVTLDGSPDLSGVATDGSHVIWLNDTTAAKRNFSKITAADNTAKTVTVANAFGFSLSGKSWAIGGKRASIGSTTSVRLFMRDGAMTTGDLLPGWAVEMESGHTETIGRIDGTFAGDTTNGPVTLKGTSGAATKPVLTHNVADLGFVPRGSYVVFKDFTLLCSSSTGSHAFYPQVVGTVYSGLTVGTSGAGSFNIGIIGVGSGVYDCEVYGTRSHGIQNGDGCITAGCYVRSCGGTGIVGTSLGNLIIGNIVNTCNKGITANLPDAGNRLLNIQRNTVYNSTSTGIEISGTNPSGSTANVDNNILVNNGGYGLNFTSATDAALLTGISCRNNATYNNTSGAFHSSSGTSAPWATNSVTLSGVPFTNAGSGDFSLDNTASEGAACRAAGFQGVFPGGLTTGYLDIGAAQHQDSGGGGTAFIIGG